jgi:Zn-dependent protease
MFRSGYLTIGRWRGAPLKLHWSIPVAAVILGGFHWRPGALLAFTLLVVIHELGHAIIVKLLRHDVVAVEVTGLGGVCRWSGNASAFEESLIAWGGVLSQLVTWVGTEVWLAVSGGPRTLFGAEMVGVFTETNLWLMAVNLIPVEPLDGARAWRLFSLWRNHSRAAGHPWYDVLIRKRKPRPPKRRRGDPDEIANRPLSADGRRVIDDLIRHTTGEVPARRDDDTD